MLICLKKIVDINLLVPIITQSLNKGQEVRLPIKGDSMMPLLCQDRDDVVLVKYNGKLKIYDLPLYYVKKDNKYVLHRVVGFGDDKSYIMCGDNCTEREYGIKDDDIIAVAKGYYRKGKYRKLGTFSQRLFCVFWKIAKPHRFKIYKLIAKLKRNKT